MMRISGSVAFLGEHGNSWRGCFDSCAMDEAPVCQLHVLREHLRTGRPRGAAGFAADLRPRMGRALVPGKRGRKRKETVSGGEG